VLEGRSSEVYCPRPSKARRPTNTPLSPLRCQALPRTTRITRGTTHTRGALSPLTQGRGGYGGMGAGANDRFSYMGKNKRGSRRGSSKIRAQPLKGGRR
jgi:hypothetical protein